MSLVTRQDFETSHGQEKIIKVIHKLEVRVYELEMEMHKLRQKDELIDKELQGPEAY
jgi:hypothetical protein